MYNKSCGILRKYLKYLPDKCIEFDKNMFNNIYHYSLNFEKIIKIRKIYVHLKLLLLIYTMNSNT